MPRGIPNKPHDEHEHEPSAITLWDHYAAAALMGYLHRGDNIENASNAAVMATKQMLALRAQEFGDE